MSRIAICLLILFGSLTTASTASAECQDPRQGWSIQSFEVYSLAVDSSVVFAGTYIGSTNGLENTEDGFTVRRLSDDSVVAGTADFFEVDGWYRASWTPSESLAVGDQLYATFAGDDSDSGDINIVVVEEVALPIVTIRDIAIEEFEFETRRRCCEMEGRCDDPCSSSCETCAVEGYGYRQLVRFKGNIDSPVFNDIYAVEYSLVQADGETPIEASGRGVKFASTGEFSGYVSGLPDGATEFCIQHDVRNLVTGEVALSDTNCAEGLSLRNVDRSDPEALDIAECSAGFVTVYDENGSEQIAIDNEGSDVEPGAGSTTEKDSGGCATGTGTPSAILVLLGLFGFGLRRRRLA